MEYDKTGIEMIDRTEALIASIPDFVRLGKLATDKQLMYLARRYGNLLERDLLFLIFKKRKLTTGGVKFLLEELEAGRTSHILVSPDSTWTAPKAVEARF